jgi:hypothetical protein
MSGCENRSYCTERRAGGGPSGWTESGNGCIVTFIDHLSKWARPLTNPLVLPPTQEVLGDDFVGMSGG